MELPIDLVPGVSPPVFVWRQVVSSPNGQRLIEHRGSLPPTVEEAVKLLIGVARQLAAENAALKAKKK